MNLSEILKTIDLSNILTIGALVLNMIALLIVAYQTRLNRKSLDLAKESIDEDRRTRQIELLPKAQLIFQVKIDFKKWVKDIDKSIKELQKAVKTKDEIRLKNISEKALNSPKNLVDGFTYKKAPPWLSEIYVAGAQYYYDFHIPLRDLWRDNRKEKPFWDLAPDLIQRGKEHSFHINKLLDYIDHAVPESYAESPASISNSRFLSD